MRDRVILRLSNDNADTQFRITGRFRGTILLKKDTDVTILDMVYVDVGYKAKRLKVNETFVVTNDGTVASLDEIPLLTDRVATSADTSYYFYLYYRTHSIDPEEQKDEAILLRSTIRDFFIERFGDGAE